MQQASTSSETCWIVSYLGRPLEVERKRTPHSGSSCKPESSRQRSKQSGGFWSTGFGSLAEDPTAFPRTPSEAQTADNTANILNMSEGVRVRGFELRALGIQVSKVEGSPSSKRPQTQRRRGGRHLQLDGLPSCSGEKASRLARRGHLSVRNKSSPMHSDCS